MFCIHHQRVTSPHNLDSAADNVMYGVVANGGSALISIMHYLG